MCQEPLSPRQASIAGTFKLATVQEYQLNRAEPRAIKDNSKLSKNQR